MYIRRYGNRLTNAHKANAERYEFSSGGGVPWNSVARPDPFYYAIRILPRAPARFRRPPRQKRVLRRYCCDVSAAPSHRSTVLLIVRIAPLLLLYYFIRIFVSFFHPWRVLFRHQRIRNGRLPAVRYTPSAFVSKTLNVRDETRETRKFPRVDWNGIRVKSKYSFCSNGQDSVMRNCVFNRST